VPVLASARGNLAHTVGRGGVVLPFDAADRAWLAALDRLMTDDAHHRRLAAAARRRAAAPELDLDRVARRFLDLIERHTRRVRLAQLGGGA
jgi:glycosyltransferase involved in cell wall biosynthesis